MMLLGLLAQLLLIQLQLGGQNPKPLTVCQVLANSLEYDGKIIWVRGELVVGPEHRFLDPNGCQITDRKYPNLVSAIWLSTPGVIGAEGSNVEMEPGTEQRLKAIIKDFGMSEDIIPGLTTRPQDMPVRKPAIIIVTGRLRARVRELPYTKNGKKAYSGYGHLSGFPAQLVIQSLTISDTVKQDRE